MKIQSNDLINLPVYTQSGQHLGRIDSFDIDLETYTITHYYVKTGLIKGLWHQQLVIAQSQVISISKEKMVVEDNIKKQPETELKKVGIATPATK
jgi:sporulation protein YlmC with PRC-barrel domain